MKSTVVYNEDSSNPSTSLLNQIVRDGARPMLAAALQAEVAAYVAQFIEQVDDLAVPGFDVDLIPP